MTQATGGAPVGNQNGHRGAIVRESIRRALAEHGKGDADKGLDKLTRKLVKLADGGEQWAHQEIYNRMSGRVAQAVEVTGANGGELVIRDANTSLGIARRIAYVIAMGAIAKAREASKEPAGAAHQKG